jgi:TonB family protein
MDRITCRCEPLREQQSAKKLIFLWADASSDDASLVSDGAGAADTLRVNIQSGTETTGVWHLAQASADIPVGAASPRLISAPQPVQSKARQPALVSVSFEIDARGFPTNIQIDKSSDRDLDDQVVAMIREWRFEAALNGGVGVPSRGYLDLSIEDAPPPLSDGQRRPRHRQ